MKKTLEWACETKIVGVNRQGNETTTTLNKRNYEKFKKRKDQIYTAQVKISLMPIRSRINNSNNNNKIHQNNNFYIEQFVIG